MTPTDAGMRAWRAFLEAHASIVKAMEVDLREECDLQRHESGGSVRMHELADHLLLSRSATTRFADRLEAAGFIERSSARSDRRGTVVTLTEAGRNELRRTAPVHLRGIVAYFDSQFDEDELHLIVELFDRLTTKA